MRPVLLEPHCVTTVAEQKKPMCMRAGQTPQPEDNGQRDLKTPVDVL